MKTYYKEIRFFKFLSFLNLLIFIGLLITALFLAAFFYQGLPEDSPIREKLKLGKLLTKFEIGHIFFDWRNLDIPIYDLNIKNSKLEKIIKGLPSENDLMTEDFKDFVNGIFIYDYKEYNVRTRIRGLTSNHWIDEKKSWRIKFDSNNLFKRKKSFNLIIPQDRAFFGEFLSNHIARKMGLLVPDDEFVFLRINGVLQGVYYEIEDLSGRFLELHGKVDRANFYREENWNWIKYGFDEIFTNVGHWKKNTSAGMDSSENYAEIDYLLRLLNGSDDRRFYNEIDQLIDMDNFLNWQAHSMILGSYHQSEHGNMNLYFNIINGKFEMIPYDVGIFPFQRLFIDSNYNPLVAKILKVPEFLHNRNVILWNYLNDGKNNQDDEEFYDSAYKKYRKCFYADRKKGFTNRYFDNKVKWLKNIFLENRQKILDNLRFANVFVNIFIEPDDEDLLCKLEVISQGFSAATLEGINLKPLSRESFNMDSAYYLYQDTNQSNSLDDSDILLSKLNWNEINKSFIADNIKDLILYPGRTNDLQPEKSYYSFFITSGKEKNNKLKDPTVELKLINSVTEEKLEPKYRYIKSSNFSRFKDILLSKEEFLENNNMFVSDEAIQNLVVLPRGVYEVNDTIIVPNGINLVIEPGVVIKFKKNTSFICYGTVRAIGTKDLPIVLTSQDIKIPWGNFALVGKKHMESEFEYVIIEYSAESYINGIFFTGGLSNHGVTTRISNCIFRHCFGDDTINIKDGIARIENSVFYDNFSDGIDFDFSEGEIIGNYLKDNGGDGFDLCRSKTLIKNNRIEGCKDKGVSVGEASKPIIINNVIRDGNIGIASKDMSDPLVINNTIYNNKVGIEAYQKKQVFGPGLGRFHNNIVYKNEKSVVVDGVCEITVKHNFIENGYKVDENISEPKPVFMDEANGDLRLKPGVSSNENLKAKLSAELFSVAPDYNKDEDYYFGIITNPIVLSLDDFQKWSD